MIAGKSVKHAALKKRIFHGKYIQGNVYCADVLQYLSRLKSSSALIIFLDPPFNLGKNYSTTHPELDRKSNYDYQTWLWSDPQKSYHLQREVIGINR